MIKIIITNGLRIATFKELFLFTLRLWLCTCVAANISHWYCWDDHWCTVVTYIYGVHIWFSQLCYICWLNCICCAAIWKALPGIWGKNFSKCDKCTVHAIVWCQKQKCALYLFFNSFFSPALFWHSWNAWVHFMSTRWTCTTGDCNYCSKI